VTNVRAVKHGRNGASSWARDIGRRGANDIDRQPSPEWGT
jgi:hypothetical protein